MGTIYDRADIYDLGFDERKHNIVKEHWQILLAEKNIKSILDCSIGSGNLTLPLAELGYNVSGSDLSEAMLSKCGKKAKDLGLSLELFQSDFRRIHESAGKTYDCVMSTGNSLPYVSNEDLLAVLEKMDLLINPSGYLYFDSRNWDKILKEKQRFYFYPPVITDEERVDSFQVWDYNPDGSMIFNIVFSFEREGNLVQREIFTEHYHPIGKAEILQKLQNMGYRICNEENFPLQCKIPLDEFEWYCILAQKG